jgi:hypothetical protein
MTKAEKKAKALALLNKINESKKPAKGKKPKLAFPGAAPLFGSEK